VNICLTGLNKEKLIDFSKEIAKVLNYKYVDADEEFAPFLIKAARYPTALVEGLLQENETQLLQQIKKMDKVVISISAEMFWFNKNFIEHIKFMFYQKASYSRHMFCNAICRSMFTMCSAKSL